MVIKIVFLVINFFSMLPINQKIKNLRLLNNLTQREMASKIGMSQPAYKKLEDGYTQITLDRLHLICRVLKTSEIELISGG